MKRPVNYTAKKARSKKEEGQNQPTAGGKKGQNEEESKENHNKDSKAGDQPPLDLLDFDFSSNPAETKEEVSRTPVPPVPVPASQSKPSDDLLSLDLPIPPLPQAPVPPPQSSQKPLIQVPQPNQNFAFDFNSVQKGISKVPEKKKPVDPFDDLEAQAKKNLVLASKKNDDYDDLFD